MPLLGIEESAEELAATTGPGPRDNVTDTLLVDDKPAGIADPEEDIIIMLEGAMLLEEAAGPELPIPSTALGLETPIAMLEETNNTEEETDTPEVAKEVIEAIDDRLYWPRSQFPKATWQPAEQ